MANTPRERWALGDVVRSLVILLGVLGAIALFFAVNRPEAQLPEPVDYVSALRVAQAEYPYEVLAPEPVPQGWRATSVEHHSDSTGNRWRLGFHASDEEFVGLEQSDGEIASFRAEKLADFTADGSSRVDGVVWERVAESDQPGDRALVRTHDGVITIVRGTVPYPVLELFASSLQ